MTDDIEALKARVRELEEREMAGREFVIRHPALTILDLAEYDAYLKIPAAFARAAGIKTEAGE